MNSITHLSGVEYEVRRRSPVGYYGYRLSSELSFLENTASAISLAFVECTVVLHVDSA